MSFTKFLRRPTIVEHLQTTAFRNAIMWGFNPIYKTLRKIHIVSRFTQLLNYLFKFEHLGWYFHPWNLWDLLSMTMKERANGSNIVGQSLTVFYFMAWNRSILFQIWNISLLWIFIFLYIRYLVEKLLFYAPHNIKVSSPSKLYMKKQISITTKYFMSTSQACKNLLRKRAKTYDESKKSINTAVATYFAS